jgi:hypothetical protein
MSEHYRALIVILILASAVFAFAKAPATALVMSVEDFERRRNLWFFVTITGFLSPNFWVFAVALIIVLRRFMRYEKNKAALFFFLIFALPQVQLEVPGFAGIRYLFQVDYSKVLILTLLLPVCMELRRNTPKNIRRHRIPDTFLAAYLILNVLLLIQQTVITVVLREILYRIADTIIPYYVLSRSLNSVERFRDVFMSFSIGAFIISLIGVVEFSRHWLLFSSIAHHWGSTDLTGGYLNRGDSLRAISSAGQSIAMGYTLAIAIGLFLYLRKSMPNWVLGLIILIGGVISPLSRGPWVGLVGSLFVIMVTSPNRNKIVMYILALSLPLMVVLLSTEFGKGVIDHLPFIGNVDGENVVYRQNLFDAAIGIVWDNILFGSTDYLLYMEHMRQGQGIIDLVNNYLIVALNSGLVGLGLYISFFVSILIGIVRTMSRLKSGSELFSLGGTLLGVMSGILITIATVSPIFNIGLLSWSLAGMGLGYCIFLENFKKKNS